ncbi:uncharacterized protein ColSpa_04737 [Colletotrichum spaethianum]|uniref:Uncharacterized protein n=1 Tax=Colletotrichum spaethianum TaxID=700344 RepID=A0AA37P5S4_9PEZI|nr:uncharacterized protein ColSpa_04737 [Colletotrichum spaethianum]GKT44556.1 hypothetical protein ColSpa_04737 [Colletotrichum spaethianum]
MSSNGSSSEAPAKPTLTDRELEILQHAWTCMKSPPEIDYPRLAAACGMTNPRSASNAWSGIKKKLFADMPAPADEDGNPVATPSKRKRGTPAKKKAVSAADEGDELANSDGEEKLVVETPKKKRNTPAKKKTAAATVVAAGTTDGEVADGEETASETPAKKKRTPAKRKTPVKGKKSAATVAADNEEEVEAAADAAAEDAADQAPAADVAKLDVQDDDKKDVDMEKGDNPDEI